ncbi:MAG: DJ-1/PfpI family protein, partial [Ferruginibacter sp.]|nr:DJ-1/PfpI family protein [Ferruginibacter sp.]
MKIGILLFENMTALDAVGPYEVLARIANAQIYFIGVEKKVYKDFYGLKLLADYSIDEIEALDILLIPGGYGIDILFTNSTLINWLKQIDKTTKFTVSVCSGALFLAEAGLLDGKRFTTHWRRKEQLKKHKVLIEDERYV